MHPDCLVTMKAIAGLLSDRYGKPLSYLHLADLRRKGRVPQAIPYGKQWRIRLGDADAVARSIGMIASQEGGQ